ncbi:hypothetical protein HY379_02810 [Candidatus Saccharibacteria bacterium]|nr:hypothetical protein [Candidatus Saccharibacteria bacterium]
MKLKQNESGFHHVGLLLLVIVLTVTGFVGWRVYQNNSGGGNPSNQSLTPLDGRIVNAFKDVGCPQQVKPAVNKSYYQGPLIDSHFHPPSIPDPSPGDTDYLKERTFNSLGVNITMSEIVCMFKNDGSTPRNILSFFPVWPNIYELQLQVVKQTLEKYPGMFVPFINPPDSDNSVNGSQTVDAEQLDKMLSVYPGLFAGYGEIGLYGREGGARPLPPDSPRLQEIYKVLRKHKIKRVFFHLGEGTKDSFERVLRANRDISFIFHGDQLITQRQNGTQDISQVEAIVKNNPNVAYGIDELFGDVFLLNEKGNKQQVLKHFSDYGPLLDKDKATWKGFIERYPDQVMWDTDRGTYLWVMDLDVGRALVSYARAFIATLDPNVQEKYAYKNAERILTDQ